MRKSTRALNFTNKQEIQSKIYRINFYGSNFAHTIQSLILSNNMNIKAHEARNKVIIGVIEEREN